MVKHAKLTKKTDRDNTVEDIKEYCRKQAGKREKMPNLRCFVRVVRAERFIISHLNRQYYVTEQSYADR